MLSSPLEYHEARKILGDASSFAQQRVKLYQPFWRPHNIMIEVQGDVVIKDIEDTATFYAGFGHSFQSIKVVACSMLNVAQLL